ncbi:MAG: class I tRNA ligase family protein, partial [Ureaplasma sp.]|nr:class I tRNA ligase family protein [Ureaplasma sp.]
MDYKNTLNMPSTDFEMKANLNQKEPIIQQEWLDKKIYQKVLEKNKDKTTFFLHDGPPYANGNIHVGHVLNKTLKDIIVRYKNFAGFKSEFIPGWDTHGLPIEVAMIKKDANAINDSVVLRRQKCRNYALEQVENQKNQLKRLGLLSDLEKKYLTLDHNFEIEQLITFYDMVSKGLIFDALKPVYWSWSSKTSLADAEIEYADVKSDSIYFSVELEDSEILGPKNKLLIWTTTPWTLPSNLAVAINPNLEYCQVLIDDQKYIIAKSLVNKIAEKINKEVIILKEFNAKEIENFKYIHPIKKDKKCPVILAEYVSADNGTGLVHNAPGFGLDDYLACKAYGINIYCPIDDDGKFTKEVDDSELENLFYIKANPIIIQRLINDNNLFLHEEIIHSAAHDWRTKKPVIYRATKQWFVNIEKVQNQIIKSLRKDVNSPHQKNTDRMIEMIQKRKEWCISRQRVWGVPLPIIYDENNNPILDLKLISNIIHILDKKGVDHWFNSDVKEYLIEPYLSNP